MLWAITLLFWWCGITTAVSVPTWKCPEIKQQPSVECSCDIPHTLRCTGDKTALKIIGRILRSLDDAAVSLLDCTIQNVSFLPESLLEGISLHGLVISSGEIREIHEYAFRGLRNPLQALGLPNNMLRNVPSGALKYLPELDRLDLSGNKMKTLDAFSFQGLQNLSFLELSDNQLAKIHPKSFNVLKHLKILRLRGNRITTPVLSNLDDFMYLEELDLSRNALTGPLKPKTLPKMQSLQDLQLSDNTLTSIKKDALQGLTNITSLSLHNNQIDVLEDNAFSQLPTLKSLDLSHNRIVAVSGASLAHLVNLHDLNLSHNFLRALTADLIKPLTSLRTLHLDDNDISIVASDAFKQTVTPTSLTLAENPLNCDCGLEEFLLWLGNSSLTERDKATIVCTTPPSLENALLSEVEAKSLECGEDDGDTFGEAMREPVKSDIKLVNFDYDGQAIKLTWYVEKSVPFTCDALFIYEEKDSNEILIESTPLKCASTNLQQTSPLTVTVPSAIQLEPQHRYRYCIVLLENGQQTDDSSLILGCSDILPLLKKQSGNKPPKLVSFQANFTLYGSLLLDMNVYPPSTDCFLKVSLMEQSTVLMQKQLNCTQTQYLFAGLGNGPYKVCANIIDPQVSDKPHCIIVYNADSKSLSHFDAAFVSIVLVGIVVVIGVVWGVRKVVGKPKMQTRQCFVPTDIDERQHSRYVKLQATTKL